VGDVVRVLPGTSHVFVNDGDETLRVVGVHDTVRHAAQMDPVPADS
jgi:hypothetical protein